MNERPPNNDATPRDGPDGISPEVRLIRDLGRAVQSLPFSDEPNTDPESIPQLLQPERLAGRTAIYAAWLLDHNHGILHGAWLTQLSRPRSFRHASPDARRITDRQTGRPPKKNNPRSSRLRPCHRR